MEFNYQGKRILLRGIQKPDLEWLGKFQQTLHKFAQVFALQVQFIPIQVSPIAMVVVEPEVQELLAKYADIFCSRKLYLHTGSMITRSSSSQVHLQLMFGPIDTMRYKRTS